MTTFPSPIYEGRWSPDMGTVLTQIAAERQRQHEKWGEQNHPDGTGGEFQIMLAERSRMLCDAKAAQGNVTWADISEEEHFEALAEDDPQKLRAELVQGAAVLVAWIECIDRRSGQ